MLLLFPFSTVWSDEPDTAAWEVHINTTRGLEVNSTTVQTVADWILKSNHNNCTILRKININNDGINLRLRFRKTGTQNAHLYER